MTNDPAIPFGPQLIGQVEKSLNAFLHRRLDGTGLDEAQWVALSLTVMSDGTGADRVTGATDAGRALFGQVRAASTHFTRQLWADLPADDLATAGRVLATILARAD